MLGYALRITSTTLRSAVRPPIGLFDESVVSMRVWPSDLDAFGHMNNGRYLTVADLGRQDMALRSGLLRAWLRERLVPVVGAATIRYKRSLRPFRRYQLHTRFLGWDDRWFYIEQRFTRRGKLYAVALIKGMVRQGGVPVAPSQMAVASGLTPESPPLPEAVQHVNDAESWLLAS